MESDQSDGSLELEFCVFSVYMRALLFIIDDYVFCEALVLLVIVDLTSALLQPILYTPGPESHMLAQWAFVWSLRGT